MDFSTPPAPSSDFLTDEDIETLFSTAYEVHFNSARTGVRLIGPAWGRTRYAGGTDAPGPLTERGHELLIAMRESNVSLDASHIDDASFWEATTHQPQVVATHSNSRALVAGNRHLSDEMAGAIAERGGVIGLVGPSKFIRPGWQDGDSRPTFAEWAAHGQHYADLFGWTHVGLGTDFDGGFGLEKAPAGMQVYRDVLRLMDELPEDAAPGVQAGNWTRWIRDHL